MNVLLWVKHHEQQVAQARRQAEIAREVLDVDDEDVYAGLSWGAAAGDSRKLRGVPVISRGVSGTQPGSDPLAALLAKERAA